MTTSLCNIFIPLVTGAEKMAKTDPHGWILSLIAVCVVFSALIILFCIYSLSGAFFSGKIKFKKGKKAPKNAEVAAAIALALQEECSDATPAAIALALELETSSQAHDIEPGIITIKHSQSAWNTPVFRKSPDKTKKI